jgi:hypothetical protein
MNPFLVGLFVSLAKAAKITDNLLTSPELSRAQALTERQPSMLVLSYRWGRRALQSPERIAGSPSVEKATLYPDAPFFGKRQVHPQPFPNTTRVFLSNHVLYDCYRRRTCAPHITARFCPRLWFLLARQDHGSLCGGREGNEWCRPNHQAQMAFGEW